MRKKEDYSRLYKPDMEKYIFLELFFGKSEPWEI